MIELCYQDRYLVAVNKPAGWLVHRSWLDRKEKVVVMQTVRDMLGQHVFTVHRLDRPTSGVLLLALSSDVAHRLAQQFERHQVKKHYLAVTRGYLEGEGLIDYALTPELDKIADKFAHLEKAPQPVQSHYHALARVEMPVAVGRYPSSRYSLMALSPLTGRKHQLRRHMAHLRHPIIDDTTHGDLRHNRGFAAAFDCRRLMLHACRLALSHPVTGVPLVIDARWDNSWQQLTRQFGWHGLLPAYEGLSLPGLQVRIRPLIKRSRLGESSAMAQIGIFVGTVYGNALLTAEEVESVLTEQGHQVTLFEDGSLEQWQAYAERVILIITSTTGQGGLPDNIVPLFQQVKDKLGHQPALRYGVIALGDSSYDTFCGAGHAFDALLQEQGATRVGDLLEIDAVEHPEPETLACPWAAQWGALL